ncbi:MAG: GDP-mannose 4,6-dehydratase [bacterium]
MAKKILVTGASGFVGTHLVKALVKNPGFQVYGTVYGQGTNLSDVLPASQIKSLDLTNAEATSELIKEITPDVIYHLAALSVVHDSLEKAGTFLTANLLMSYNLLESVRLHAPSCRVLAICSANEYGLVDEKDIPIDEDTPLKPLNPYAVSKVAQDMLAYQYFLAYGLDIVRLRPFNHTGPGQTTEFLIPSLASQFVAIGRGEKEPKIEVGNTESIRDFSDVSDMVDAYLLAADKCQKGEVYNIGFGKGISVGEIIKLFEEISGVKVEVVSNTSRVRTADVPVLIADASKFIDVTGWQPQIKFKDTLLNVYNYYQSLTT